MKYGSGNGMNAPKSKKGLIGMAAQRWANQPAPGNPPIPNQPMATQTTLLPGGASNPLPSIPKPGAGEGGAQGWEGQQPQEPPPQPTPWGGTPQAPGNTGGVDTGGQPGVPMGQPGGAPPEQYEDEKNPGLFDVLIGEGAKKAAGVATGSLGTEWADLPAGSYFGDMSQALADSKGGPPGYMAGPGETQTVPGLADQYVADVLSGTKEFGIGSEQLDAMDLTDWKNAAKVSAQEAEKAAQMGIGASGMAVSGTGQAYSDASTNMAMRRFEAEKVRLANEAQHIQMALAYQGDRLNNEQRNALQEKLAEIQASYAKIAEAQYKSAEQAVPYQHMANALGLLDKSKLSEGQLWKAMETFPVNEDGSPPTNAQIADWLKGVYTAPSQLPGGGVGEAGGSKYQEMEEEVEAHYAQKSDAERNAILSDFLNSTEASQGMTFAEWYYLTYMTGV